MQTDVEVSRYFTGIMNIWLLRGDQESKPDYMERTIARFVPDWRMIENPPSVIQLLIQMLSNSHATQMLYDGLAARNRFVAVLYGIPCRQLNAKICISSPGTYQIQLPTQNAEYQPVD